MVWLWQFRVAQVGRRDMVMQRPLDHRLWQTVQHLKQHRAHCHSNFAARLGFKLLPLVFECRVLVQRQHVALVRQVDHVIIVSRR